jgi:hypothetical protein
VTDTQTDGAAVRPARPLAELRAHGLLWLINRTVFHPRGYALGFDVDDTGDVTGWVLYGDGTEPWKYATEIDEDDLFARAEAFLSSLHGHGTSAR